LNSCIKELVTTGTKSIVSALSGHRFMPPELPVLRGILRAPTPELMLPIVSRLLFLVFNVGSEPAGWRGAGAGVGASGLGGAGGAGANGGGVGGFGVLKHISLLPI